MMSKTRFNSIYQGLTSVAQRVYEAVPINEPWTFNQIHEELVRSTGSHRERRLTDGCLRSLVESRLIRENPAGHFIRIGVRAPADQPQHETTDDMATSPSTAQPTTLDKLSDLSARARKLSKELDTLASDIETIALEVDERMGVAESEMQAVRALKNLLNKIPA